VAQSRSKVTAGKYLETKDPKEKIVELDEVLVDMKMYLKVISKIKR
jgi:hypothetical protein